MSKTSPTIIWWQSHDPNNKKITNDQFDNFVLFKSSKTDCHGLYVWCAIYVAPYLGSQPSSVGGGVYDYHPILIGLQVITGARVPLLLLQLQQTTAENLVGEGGGDLPSRTCYNWASTYVRQVSAEITSYAERSQQLETTSVETNNFLVQRATFIQLNMLSRTPVLRDNNCLAQGIVFQDRFYCTCRKSIIPLHRSVGHKTSMLPRLLFFNFRKKNSNS